jgi:hypothetical protein
LVRTPASANGFRGVVVTSDAEEEELDTGQGSAFRDGLHQRATDAAPVIRVHDLDGDIRALGVRGIPDPATDTHGHAVHRRDERLVATLFLGGQLLDHQRGEAWQRRVEPQEARLG